MGDLSAVPLKALDTAKGSDLSIKILSAVWNLSLGNSTDKLVLAALADYANDSGRCFPSIAALCQRTDLSERPVYRSLKRLKEKGYVEVIHRHRHSNVFQLTLPAPRAAKDDSDLPQRQGYLPLMQVIPAPGAVRTVKDPSLNLRERKSAISAEDQELEARGRDLCFRTRMSDESAAHYREALDRFETENSTTVAYLKEHAARRRKNDPHF